MFLDGSKRPGSGTRNRSLAGARRARFLERFLLTLYTMLRIVLDMKRANFYLPEDQLKRLKALQRRTGAPASELVRRAIEAYLKKNRA